MAETSRALSCPQCGGTIALRAAGVTVTLVCEHCGSALDMTRGVARLIASAQDAMRRPEIALGTRGLLDGVQWEVVGYLERSDGWADWSEYLLFNPYEGYRFLIDDGRRFSVGRLMDGAPEGSWDGLSLGGQSYARFGQTYRARVTFVVGEFYWRVAVGEQAELTDYVRPGLMISCEENDKERTWTRTALLKRGVAERAFGLSKRLYSRGTPAPHEPSPTWDLFWPAMAIAAIAVVALIAAILAGPSTQRLATATVQAPVGGGARSSVVGPITLTQPYSRIEIGARAAVDNQWVDLDYSLVDRRTQESYDSYATAEYYHGYSGGESWREGDSTPHVSLSGIPAGTYDLVVEASAQRWFGGASSSPIGAGPGAADSVEVAIEIDSGGWFGGNLVLALFLIAIWPAILALIHFDHEARRTAPVREED